MTTCPHCHAEFVGNMDRESHRVSHPADPNWLWEKRCLDGPAMEAAGMRQDDTGRWYLPAMWCGTEPLEA